MASKGWQKGEKYCNPTKASVRPIYADFFRGGQPVVNRRDVRIYGPAAIRDRKTMISSAEVLVRYGWLVPIEPRRYDGFRWRIVRKLVAHPTVANQVAK
jgi:hypothetical protein